MSHPLVQSRPQCFGLPVVESLLQLGVEAPVVFGVDFQLFAELAKVSLNILTALGLDKEVKHSMGTVGGVLARHGGERRTGPRFFGRQVGLLTVEDEERTE